MKPVKCAFKMIGRTGHIGHAGQACLWYSFLLLPTLA